MSKVQNSFRASLSGGMIYNCVVCGVVKNRRGRTCQKCYGREYRKKNRIRLNLYCKERWWDIYRERQGVIRHNKPRKTIYNMDVRE